MTCQGRVLPTQELRIVDGDGKPLPAGRPGDIQIRGLITPGYLDTPDLDAGAFASGGWFRTSDVGLLDASRRLHYLGRKADIVKVNGINVSPAEVEKLLVAHPGVDDAFAFGLPTADGDQVLACVLVSSTPPHGHGDLVIEVRAWARTQMASYKVPTVLGVRRAEELPLTVTGKVSRRALQAQLHGTPAARTSVD
jgi:fatty-acyl-CoA synthase